MTSNSFSKISPNLDKNCSEVPYKAKVDYFVISEYDICPSPSKKPRIKSHKYSFGIFSNGKLKCIS